MHVYSPGTRANSPGGQQFYYNYKDLLLQNFFIVTERVCYFDYKVQVSAISLQQILRKSCFNILPIQINAQVGKLDLAVKRSIVSLGSSSEQT